MSMAEIPVIKLYATLTTTNNRTVPINGISNASDFISSNYPNNTNPYANITVVDGSTYNFTGKYELPYNRVHQCIEFMIL